MRPASSTSSKRRSSRCAVPTRPSSSSKPIPGASCRRKTLVDYLESRTMPHCLRDQQDRPPRRGFSKRRSPRCKARTDATSSPSNGRFSRAAANERRADFRGYVDLADMKAHSFERDGENESAIPGDVSSARAAAHGELLEAMADFDDHLMEELLEGIEPPLDEVERDLCNECSHDQIVPVLVAAGAPAPALPRWCARSNSGSPRRQTRRCSMPKAARSRPIQPRPVDRAGHQDRHPPAVRKTLDRARRLAERSNPTRRSPTSRKGDEKVRSGGFYRLAGQETRGDPRGRARRDRRDRAARGGRDRRHADVATGTRCCCRALPVAEPVFAIAIKPKERIDEAKISQMLARIVDEDPSLRLTPRRDHRTSLLFSAAASSTSRSRSNGSHASIKSKSKRPRRRFRISRRSRAGPRSTRATNTRPAVTANSATCGCASNRASAARRHLRGEDRRRRRSAAVHSGRRKGRARSACCTGRTAIPSPTCTSRSSTGSTTTSTRASSRSKPPPAWACARRCRNAIRSCSSRSSHVDGDCADARTRRRSSSSSPANAGRSSA